MGGLASTAREDVRIREMGGKGCKYCTEVLNAAKCDVSGQPWNTVLFESEHFTVVPTLGAIVEGWVLIISKAHLVCMGKVAPETRQELDHVLSVVQTAVGREYGPATVFEHGPNGEGLSIGCGIDHAHLHVVPLEFDLVEAAKTSPEFCGCHWVEDKGMLAVVGGLCEERQSYVYIKNAEGMENHCVPENIPCQSLRRIIARKSGRPLEYDYKQHAFRENVLRTAKRLGGVFGGMVRDLA